MIMNKHQIFQLFKYTALALIGVSALLLTIAMLTVYEPNTSYFSANTPLPLLATLCALVGAACGIASALFITPAKTLSSPFFPSAAFFSCIGFLFGGILLLFNSTRSQAPLTAFFFFIAALYSLLSAFASPKAANSVTVILGFLTVIACALGNVYCYFDVSLEMNAPVKIILQTALLFTMIYYTAEIRFLLAREKKRFYLALAFCALAASAMGAISVPIAYFSGALNRTDYFALSVVLLGVAFSLLLRILFYTHQKKEGAAEPIFTEGSNTSPSPADSNGEPDIPLTDDDIANDQKETDEE